MINDATEQLRRCMPCIDAESDYFGHGSPRNFSFYASAITDVADC